MTSNLTEEEKKMAQQGQIFQRNVKSVQDAINDMHRRISAQDETIQALRTALVQQSQRTDLLEKKLNRVLAAQLTGKPTT